MDLFRFPPHVVGDQPIDDLLGRVSCYNHFMSILLVAGRQISWQQKESQSWILR